MKYIYTLLQDKTYIVIMSIKQGRKLAPPELKEAIAIGNIPAITKEIFNMANGINAEFIDGGVVSWSICGKNNDTKNRTNEGNIDSLSFVLENGADPNTFSFMSKPVFLAAKEGDDKMIALLNKYGSDLDAFMIKKNNYSKKLEVKLAIIHAIEHQYMHCVEALVKLGAVYNLRTVSYAKKIMEEKYESRREGFEQGEDYDFAKKIYETLYKNYDELNECMADSVKKKIRRKFSVMETNILHL
jgi:transcription termination factor NusB